MSTAATLPADRRVRPGLLAVAIGVVLAHASLLGGGGWLSREAAAPAQQPAVALEVRTVPAPAVPPAPDALAPVVAEPPRGAPVGPVTPRSSPGRRSSTAPPPSPTTTTTTTTTTTAATATATTDVAAAPRHASAASSPVPVYRTRLPPPGQWRYVLRRAGREGEARLRWRHDGQRYDARLDASAPGDDGEASLQWHSSGEIDDAGIAPKRFVDRRDRRRAAANFDRDGARIGYSTTAQEQVLWPGGQDRLSVLLQLPAILDGRRTPAAMGEEVLLQVTGARGDAQLWRFEVQGPERVTLPDGSQRFALKLLREPSHAWDTRVEVWTDPQAHHLPLRVVMRNGARVLELLLQGPADNDEREP